MTVHIILTTPDTDAGPFNLYSDVDGFVSPFGFNISKATLLAGYSVVVPDGTTEIRIVSVGECTNSVEFSVINLCPTINVYLILDNGDLLSYNPDTEEYQYLSTIDDGPDVAMTNDKMFVIDFNTILWEYDITISPWSITLNRTIDLSALLPYGAGLEAVSNTKLLYGGNYIYEIDISGSEVIQTALFQLPGGDDSGVSGDIYYNVFKNLIYVTYYNADTEYLEIGEFTYDGTLINSNLLTLGKSPYGMFNYDGVLYVINSDGSIYSIDPITLESTFVNDLAIPYPRQIYGAAQPSSCRNNIVPLLL